MEKNILFLPVKSSLSYQKICQALGRFAPFRYDFLLGEVDRYLNSPTNSSARKKDKNPENEEENGDEEVYNEIASKWDSAIENRDQMKKINGRVKKATEIALRNSDGVELLPLDFRCKNRESDSFKFVQGNASFNYNKAISVLVKEIHRSLFRASILLLVIEFLTASNHLSREQNKEKTQYSKMLFELKSRAGKELLRMEKHKEILLVLLGDYFSAVIESAKFHRGLSPLEKWLRDFFAIERRREEEEKALIEEMKREEAEYLSTIDTELAKLMGGKIPRGDFSIKDSLKTTWGKVFGVHRVMIN